jgi:hypothetical protein
VLFTLAKKMSSLRQYFYSFDDGKRAADQILGLIAQITPELKAQCDENLPESELENLWAEFETRSKSPEPMPCVKGLFSRLIKSSELESPLITLWGADDFWDNQSNYAPICEINSGLGFIQCGSWTGHSDGDAWLIDTQYGYLAALTLGLPDFSLETVRSECYLKFYSPWQWSSFLRCEAWEREWIDQQFGS